MRVLGALNEQTRIPDEVIVVNNGSSDRIPIEVFNKNPVSVMNMGENKGFAVANNRAIEQLISTDWVALLNPDAIPDKDWLRQLMAAVESYPEASAFGSKQLMGNNPALIDGLGDVYHVSGAAWRACHGQPDESTSTAVREIFAPCAAAAIYKRTALLEVGGFDEDFFCYFEDVNLGFRLRLLGHKLMLAPAAIVYHIGGATSGGDQSDFAVYHGQRNLIWTYFKNMPKKYILFRLVEHLLFNLASIVFFTIKGKGRVVLRAKWNALQGLPKMLRKRFAIQSNTSVSQDRVYAAMNKGFLAPYRRKLAVHSGNGRSGHD